jgi:TolB protein
MNNYLGYSVVLFFIITSLFNGCKKSLEPINNHPRQQIAFTSDRDGDTDIYTMNDKGEKVRNLTNNNDYEYPPKFSPDGTKIVFVSNRLGPLAIYIMNIDGSNESFIEYGSAPNFSPDGNTIVFKRKIGDYYEICSIAVSGGEFFNLTQNNVTDNSPVYSPDGSKIVFISDADEDSAEQDWQLFIMNHDGTNSRQLTNSPSGVRPFSMSPNGLYIAYIGEAEEIELFNLNSSTSTTLTNNNEVNVHNSLFSPDGTSILYIGFIFAIRDVEICSIDIDGKSNKNLTNSQGTDGSPQFSDDGTLITFYSDRDGNGEIYIMNSNGRNQTNISNHPSNDGNPIFQPMKKEL